MIIFLFIVKMDSSQINQMRFSMDHVADIPPRQLTKPQNIREHSGRAPLALQLPRHSLHMS